jgi:hypothetical protein
MKRRINICIVCNKEFMSPLKTGSPPKLCSKECRQKSRSISLRKYADKNKFEEERTCPVCGTRFIAQGKGSGKLYCSHECSTRQEHDMRNMKRQANTPTGVCPQCGEAFKKRRKKGTYCSRKCYAESRKAKEQTSICPACGQEFNQRGHKLKYCSHSCSVKAQAEVYRRNTTTRRALRVTNGNVETINPKEIFERDGWRCQLCGKKVDKRLYKTKGTAMHSSAPSLDHIIPISRGGEHTKANVQCACYLCNCRKGNKVIGQLRLFG